MSRCFPFPPPGYEKTTRNDDTNLITKKKHKEKKHKKDKKDKGKTEGKEKKDDERSKEKRREKKERKEKKKDKREKNKDRDKKRTSDDKRIEDKPASYNGEKADPNNMLGVEISNSKIVQHLGQRLGDKDKFTGTPMVPKVTLSDKVRPELRGSVVDSSSGNLVEEKRKFKDTGKINGHGDKVEVGNSENAAAHSSGWADQKRIEQGSINSWSEGKRKTNYKNDIGKVNGQGNKVEARVSEVSTVHNSSLMDQRRVAQNSIGNWAADEERMSKDKYDAGKANGQGNKVEARASEKATVLNSPWMYQRTEQSIIGDWAEEKSKAKDKEDARITNGQGKNVEERVPETATVHISAWMDQRIEGIQFKTEDLEKQVDVKDNNKHNRSHSRGDKKKKKDREKKGKSKDKHSNKEKEKMEKMEEKRDPYTNRNKLKGSNQASVDTASIKSEALSKENNKSFATSGNLGKRKEPETNGLFHENLMPSNKLPRPIPTSHLGVENGRKPEPRQIIAQVVPEKQGLPFNHKTDMKGHRINGLARTQISDPASVKSSSATTQTIEKCGASAKLPHPDAKYLSQVLRVPKLEEYSDFDDQEWLFSGKKFQSKKMEVDSEGFDGMMQVWGEAVPVKSADITAMPYVIPY